MRLVNDDGKAPVAVFVADFVEDEREFLHRANDDLFAALDELPQIAGMFRVADGLADLGKLLDGRLNLLVEDAPVGDDDDGIKNVRFIFTQTKKLMRQPCDRIRLPAPGRMLDEITVACPMRRHFRQNLPHHVKLVETRKNLLAFLFARLQILLFDNLRVVFQNVRQSLRREDAFPKIIRFESFRVGRIARAVIPALVERQKPRRLAFQVRAKHHRLVVHREMHHAAPELKQLFARVAVAAVLLHRVFDRLLGQAVFQFKRGDGQAVNELAQVQRPARFVRAVTQLAGDAETVFCKQRCRRRVARRWRAVK